MQQKNAKNLLDKNCGYLMKFFIGNRGFSDTAELQIFKGQLSAQKKHISMLQKIIF